MQLFAVYATRRDWSEDICCLAMSSDEAWLCLLESVANLCPAEAVRCRCRPVELSFDAVECIVRRWGGEDALHGFPPLNTDALPTGWGPAYRAGYDEAARKPR